MRNVAAAVGMRAPSLYEHVTGKRALERTIIADGLREQAEALNEALATTKGAADPLASIFAAWRCWAVAHPHLYHLIYVRDLDRSDPEIASAEQAASAPLRDICGGDLASAHVLWAFAHGMVNLELSHRFPPSANVNELWARGLSALRMLVPEA